MPTCKRSALINNKIYDLNIKYSLLQNQLEDPPHPSCIENKGQGL
jgi:hypothetical protein